MRSRPFFELRGSLQVRLGVRVHHPALSSHRTIHRVPGQGGEEMSPMIVGSIGIILMLVLLVLGMPIGYGMALIGFLGVWYFTSIPAVINMAATVPYDAMANYGLCVLPLFLLFGAVCKNSEMGRDLFNMAYKSMGRVPGALALACLVEGTIFGAISSSGIATIVTVGKVSLPEMKKGKRS